VLQHHLRMFANKEDPSLKQAQQVITFGQYAGNEQQEEPKQEKFQPEQKPEKYKQHDAKDEGNSVQLFMSELFEKKKKEVHKIDLTSDALTGRSGLGQEVEETEEGP